MSASREIPFLFAGLRAGWLVSAACAWALAYGCAEEVPRCDGNVLVRYCAQRECVESGVPEGGEIVRESCLAGECVAANGTAECVLAPMAACTRDQCEAGELVECGATGFVTRRGACDDGRTCLDGGD